MYENQLYPEILENTFRYGVEIRKGLIVKKHAKYTVGLYYKYDDAEEEYKITFVYKR